MHAIYITIATFWANNLSSFLKGREHLGIASFGKNILYIMK